jgi:DNA helicase-2/ATP-dependent DNA helicase PcrA
VQALEVAPLGGPPWAEGLNASQRRAVDHSEGPLLIAAGAGTGKTRTLVARLARLLDEGTAPERILLVTFSRRAAAELVRRAS